MKSWITRKKFYISLRKCILNFRNLRYMSFSNQQFILWNLQHQALVIEFKLKFALLSPLEIQSRIFLFNYFIKVNLEIRKWMQTLSHFVGFWCLDWSLVAFVTNYFSLPRSCHQIPMKFDLAVSVCTILNKIIISCKILTITHKHFKYLYY